jgi:hypothetical protein
MSKKFIIAWVVIFVAWMAGSFVVHGTLLHGDYAKLPNLMRPEAEQQQFLPWMILAHVFLSGAFVWIYARGVEAGKAWTSQGVRYGIAVAFLTVVPTYMIYYCVQPTPGMLVIKQMAFDGILIVILGVIVAWLHREQAAA